MSKPDTIGWARWLIAWPLILYLRHSKVSRGKGFIVRHVLKRVLPRAPKTFKVILARGYLFDLRFQETIGISFLVDQVFEPVELEFVFEMLTPGSVVFDVGANVGIHTIHMSDAVGPGGMVIAFEPDSETARRLRRHVLQNRANNVTIVAKAVGSEEGRASLIRDDDPAYNTLSYPGVFDRGQQTAEVEMTTLDAEWKRLGRPVVSFVKVDVEGSEFLVLRGASCLLAEARPLLMLEANSAGEYARLESFLRKFDYAPFRPVNFEEWNHLFRYVGKRDKNGS